MKVTFSSVSKNIKNHFVVRDVNLVLESGYVYGLQGINGSGKTMIMRLLAGLIRPTSGVIMLDDKILWKDLSFPESIGVLIENPAFLDAYSGFQNLEILASIKNIANETRIREVLSLVGLSPDDKKKYRKYSLGMKQRLGIAASVLESPDIIILDEPTNSHDSDGVNMVIDLVKAEKARGALIVLTCHDKEVLHLLSDEVFSIREGVLSKKGAVDA